MPKQNPRAARARRRVPIPIRQVDFVMYCTKDMRKTRGFYQKLFGFGRGEEWNNFWSEFNTEPVTLCLNGPGPTEKWDWQGSAAIALAVEDIHAAIQQCRKRRVKILMEPVKTRVCWMAFIADPAGNRICLHQKFGL
jgi:predicted enzyme related to lactoylglutathione lyase